jgi:hypothetical protein
MVPSSSMSVDTPALILQLQMWTFSFEMLCMRRYVFSHMEFDNDVNTH